MTGGLADVGKMALFPTRTISRPLPIPLTQGSFHGGMQSSHILDPDLARQTRVGHLILFVAGTLLVLPAAFATYILGVIIFDSSMGSLSGDDLTIALSAGIPSVAGVLAWAALGLLLTKPAYPKWHLACWSLVLFFGLCAVPCCLCWLSQVHSVPPGLSLVAVFALLAGVASTAIAGRNLRLARLSLLRGADFLGSAFPRS